MSSFAAELERLWSSAAAAPDLAVWWSSAAADAARTSPADQLAALRLDQRRRWQTDQPWRVEDYLERLRLPAGTDWRRELLSGEIAARRDCAVPLTPEELSSRFPDLSDTFHRQLIAATPANSAVDDVTKDMDLLAFSSGSAVWIPVDAQERYVIQQAEKALGEGAFAEVFRAIDTVLKRSVAVKVLKESTFTDLEDAEEFLREARLAAKLTHPFILPVFDAGLTIASENFSAGRVYAVTQLFTGGTLKEHLAELRGQHRLMDVRIAVRLLLSLAEALDYAWSSGSHIVHRDVKPGNILLDKVSGRPCLADFGLSIWDEDGFQRDNLGGTPIYMSPEQLAGETHRLTGKSDVFALGIILYEMLAGTRPFASAPEIKFTPPAPPRALQASIPPELERICLKALAKQTADRYSAAELAADLQKFLEGRIPVRAAASNGAVKPKGLRSFDDSDADFFLDLLPGQRNFDGLPDSIVFWKTRIEEQAAAKTFSVGLIYGPSGCGKSSFVKAGLRPQLADGQLTTWLEATPETTERQLLCQLRDIRPDLASTSGGLRELCAAIRSNPGPKVTMFLDQFEQWLHRNPCGPETELVQALRHCDGTRLQAVIMIREDFYGAVTDLMRLLDVPLIQHHNVARLDRFELPHAIAVLQKFGSGYGKLPQPPELPTAGQQEFLAAAVAELLEDNRVISVRLALFAEMVRNEPWEQKTLQQVGGAAGIGRAFLEETFSSPRSDIRWKRHLPAVRGILKALLPDIDTDIKGGSRTAEELQLAAGYEHRPRDFEELITLLDKELRLITPKETETTPTPDTISTHSELPAPASPSWQLTHDYLVPSLREWLSRKQKETVAGRAELKLEDCTLLYKSRGERRHLPGFFDWLQILIFTRRRRWTPAETAVMRTAGRQHAVRGTAIATVLLAVGLALQAVLVAKAIEGLAGQIQTAGPSGLSELLQQADEQGSALDERLRPIIQAADKPDADATVRLAAVPARLVVVIRDASQLPPLQEAMLTGELTYVEPIRRRLRLYADQLRPQWLELLRNSGEPAARRFRAALGLVGLDGDQPVTGWTDADIEFIATELSTSFAEYQPQLRELLRPIGKKLVPVLDQLFDADTSTADQQISAALALADFARDDKELLARLLTRATARQTDILYPLVAEMKSGPVRDGLLALTKEQPDENLGQLARVNLGRRRANAAITLLRQGERDAYFDALRITDDPESLSQFVHRCRAWGVTPQELLESFERCAALRTTAIGAARRLESRVMYGLLIALGSYPLDQIPAGEREAVFTKLRALYASDPSAAVHSGSGWLLRTWGREADVSKLDEVEVPYDASGERDWFRLRVGVAAKSSGLFGGLGLPGPLQHYSLTFVVFPAGEYRLGSPESEGGELDRNIDETPRVVKLTRPFALCDREVTWGLFQAFDGGEHREGMVSQFGWELRGADVVFGQNYFDWIRFCRWLTGQYRGDEESWQCYRDPAQLEQDGNGNSRVGRLLVERGGFRMPTESEWEVGARAGQRTAYTFGGDVSLLSSYGWFLDNSGKRPQLSAAKPPGIGGLHDMQGNLFEWVHDWYNTIEGGSVIVDPQVPLSGQSRVLRGGGWGIVAALCRTAYRSADDPAYRFTLYGFRLALSPSVGLPEAGKKELQQEGN